MDFVREWSLRALCLRLLIAVLPLSSASADESTPETFRVPAQVLAGEARGAYPTGTFEALWVDAHRKDPSTANPDDPRKLMVQVWYPAAVSKETCHAPYALHPELYASDHWVRRLAHLETLSCVDAPLAASPRRFPVLLYSHGREFPHFSGTFQTEFLASQGYVVVAIGHSGVNGVRRFTDGTNYEEDGQRYSAQYAAATALSAKERELSSREQFELLWARADLGLYLQDVSFVLNHLAALDAESRDRFHGRLDLKRVGMLGWSLGGIIAFQATRTEPRIQAAVNLDGWPFGWLGENGVVTRGSERPLLLMNGKASTASTPEIEIEAGDEELRSAAETYYWTMLRRSTRGWYRVGVRGASHMNFSDFTLFEPQSPEAINPHQAHLIVNAYTLEFFDKYLRRRERTPLLDGTERYPETELLHGKASALDAPIAR